MVAALAPLADAPPLVVALGALLVRLQPTELYCCLPDVMQALRCISLRMAATLRLAQGSAGLLQDSASLYVHHVPHAAVCAIYREIARATAKACTI